MRHYEIVKIKENGKIEIPLEFAYEIGLVKGSYFLIEIDTDLKEVHIERVALPGKKLVEIELVVEDKPGFLQRLAERWEEIKQIFYLVRPKNSKVLDLLQL